ncbi:MAG: hypothetical protein HY064_03725 [Bacteroidetes bacterium]|nr:hypothetical protein [Bacteroidota bacterium]
MPQQHRDYLYEKFENGKIPNQNDFDDSFDSALNLLDDGVTILKTDTPTGQKKHVGINQPEPDCLVSIKGDTLNEDKMICFESTDGSQEWNINLNPTSGNVKGFSIDNSTTGSSISNLFIDATTGNVGINSIAPPEKLHVLDGFDGGAVSILITNFQSGHDGWNLSAIDDNAISQREGAFGLREKNGSTNIERITVLPKITTATNTYYRTGIGTQLPYSTLHVDRPEADAQTNIALNENTGIILSGSMIGHNLALDNHQIQARSGDFSGGDTTIQVLASQLNLQPFGGGFVINNSLSSDKKITVDSTGKLGLGIIPTLSSDKITVGGAVTFGDSLADTAAEGTVRWHSVPGAVADLQVFKGGVWKSLTTQTVTSNFWTAGPQGSGIIFYESADGPKVGIGIDTPTVSLEVDENVNGVSNDSFTAIFRNESVGAQGTTHVRSALNVHTTGMWSGNENAYNVALYVSESSGQTLPNSNLAAVLNGNVVIGNVTGLPIIGSNGTNVLALQTGATPPSSIPGSVPNSGVQLFSKEIGIGGVLTSVFNVMTGDSEIIQLYQQSKLSPSANANNPNTGDNNTNDLIINMRDRINALEQVLKNLNLLSAV